MEGQTAATSDGPEPSHASGGIPGQTGPRQDRRINVNSTQRWSVRQGLVRNPFPMPLDACRPIPMMSSLISAVSGCQKLSPLERFQAGL